MHAAVFAHSTPSLSHGFFLFIILSFSSGVICWRFGGYTSKLLPYNLHVSDFLAVVFINNSGVLTSLRAF